MIQFQNFVILLTSLTFILFLILLWKYLELKSVVEQKAMQKFENWKKMELEAISTKKAEILFREWKQEYEQKIRKDAIEKSKAVIAGKATEHLIPYFPNFKYNPKNVRFIGSPVDLIVFDGLDEGKVRNIVFVEVKYGKSSLTKREKQVKEAIEKKRVKWETIRVNKN